MATNEHVVGGEHKGVDDMPRSVILSPEVYNTLKAKAYLYDEYLKQSRYYNRMAANNNHEDDGK